MQSATYCTEAQKADILAAKSVTLSLRFLFLWRWQSVSLNKEVFLHHFSSSRIKQQSVAAKWSWKIHLITREWNWAVIFFLFFLVLLCSTFNAHQRKSSAHLNVELSSFRSESNRWNMQLLKDVHYINKAPTHSCERTPKRDLAPAVLSDATTSGAGLSGWAWRGRPVPRQHLYAQWFPQSFHERHVQLFICCARGRYRIQIQFVLRLFKDLKKCPDARYLWFRTVCWIEVSLWWRLDSSD